MKLLVLVSIFIFCITIINGETFSTDKDDTTSTTHQSVKKVAIDHRRPQTIPPRKNMQEHLHWGKKTDPKANETGYYTPFYTAYGPCKSEKNITYEQIKNYTQISMIQSAYAEIFSVACEPHFVVMINTLFVNGYIKVGPDNSLVADFLFRETASDTEMELINTMMELAAFSQVYVSWHKFPVTPVNPKGKRIPHRCFIEVVSRLHALDLMLRSGYWLVGQLGTSMEQRFEPVVNQIRTEFTTHNGSGRILHEKKKCLVVAMALYDYLAFEAKRLRKAKCSHDKFKEYFMEHEKLYVTTFDGYR